MPATAAAYGVNLHDGRVTDDLNGAARYMADSLKRTGGDYAAALSVYNSGRPDAYKDPHFAGGQTYNYVKGILAAAGSTGKSPKVRRPTSPAPTTTTQTVTTPGTDNSALRRQLVGQFLAQGGIRNSSAVLGLAAQYGQAADVPGTTTTQRVKAPSQGSTSGRASPSAGKSGSKVLELIYNDGGNGYGIKDGQTVNGSQFYAGVWAGHANHVHVAAGPKTIVALGKLAQRLGLHVGENPAFGGVNPVHTPGSYHYKDEAIDASGDPALMKRFARAVAQYNRTKRLPSK